MTEKPNSTDSGARYARQTLLPQIEHDGQERLGCARVLLVGCGALGTVIAEQLIRAGVRFIRICDRDLVELTNLQRQALFDESDAAGEKPKAIAAAERLARINSNVVVQPHVVDVHSGNIEALADGVEIILDGTDNVETRYLINDLSIKTAIPWVYGACVGVEGRAMGIVPGRGPCLRCLFEPAGPGELATCDTAGVLNSAAAMVASLQVTFALKILLGQHEPVMVKIDAWTPRFREIHVSEARRENCVACGQRRFEFLDRPASASAATLCGRGAVQVRPAGAASLDLDALAKRLASAGELSRNPYFLRCELREARLSLTVFPDGRALVHGTSDISAARSVYARYIGS